IWRCSIVTSRPTTITASASPWRNCLSLEPFSGAWSTNPITGTDRCCALAASGHAAAEAPRTVRNERRCIERLLFDDLISQDKQFQRDREPQRLGCLAVDGEEEARRLLHRQIGRLGAFENLVHVKGRAAKEVGGTFAVAHQPASFDEIADGEHG